MSFKSICQPLLALVILLLLGYASGFAYAQQTDVAEDSATNEDDERLDADSEELVQELVNVTGSRIRADEYYSKSPLQTITAESAIAVGLIDAADILQSSSISAGSIQVDNSFGGYVIDGGPGIQTLSLRGLGAKRTLILLNGRRFPPAGIGGTVGPVDLNTIPTQIVDRYEIVKDGTSSIYGSDAVAGVTNVITKTDITGMEVFGSITDSELGGSDVYAGGLAMGFKSEEGSFLLTSQFTDQKMLRAGEREEIRCPLDYTWNADGRRADPIDPATGTYKCVRTGGREGHAILFGSQDDNGRAIYSWGPFSGTTPIRGGQSRIEGYKPITFEEASHNDPREYSESVYSPIDTISVFSSFDYKFSDLDSTTLFGEILWNRRRSSFTGFRQLFPYFHPEVSRTLPDGRNLNPFAGQGHVLPIVLVPYNSSEEVEVGRFLGGVRGDINNGPLEGWKWDIFISASSSSGDYLSDIIPTDRLNAGTGTLQAPNSNAGELNPDGICGTNAPDGCVPLDIFAHSAISDGRFSARESEYFFETEKGNTEYEQLTFEATLNGNILKLPSGYMAGAFGASFRKDEISDVPGAFSLAGNSWGRNKTGTTKGNDRLIEVFTEIEVPIIREQDGFKDLSLNMSSRYSNYQTTGDATTYKFGVNWQVSDGVRFRATTGTSYRAPSLYELHLAPQTSYLNPSDIDPCIDYGRVVNDIFLANATLRQNCRNDGLAPTWQGGVGSIEVVTGGVETLEAESSRAHTVGLVLTPADAGLSFALDYFNIIIINAVSARAPSTLIDLCYRYRTVRDVEKYCELFRRVENRSAANYQQVEYIDASYQNIAAQKTAGVDITLEYLEEFDFGEVAFETKFTWTMTDEEKAFPDSEVYDFNGEQGEPEWVGYGAFSFRNRADWQATWRIDYIGETRPLVDVKRDGSIESGQFIIPSVEPFVHQGISIQKKWERVSVTLGIRNVFNAKAPKVSRCCYQRQGNFTFYNQYKTGIIGRSTFMSLRYKF